VLDVGKDDGVMVGMQVFTDGDFVLGEITQIFGHSAVATLYSASGNQLTAYIGATSTPTTAYGVGGGNFRAVLPKGIDIAIGDTVDIPSLAPAYLGLVEAVVRSEHSSLQEIYFRWPINLTALRYVYIGMPYYPETMSE
jgi:cell shape-determining protein MreC